MWRLAIRRRLLAVPRLSRRLLAIGWHPVPRLRGRLLTIALLRRVPGRRRCGRSVLLRRGLLIPPLRRLRRNVSAPESLLCTNPAAKRLAVGKLLHGTESSAHTPVTAVAEREEVKIHATIHAAVDFGLIDDRIEIGVNHGLLLLAAGRKYPMPFAFWTKRLPIFAEAITIPNRNLRLRRSGSIPDTCNPFLDCRLDRSINALLGCKIAFGDQNRDAVFRLLPGLIRVRLKKMYIAESYLASRYGCRFYLISHCRFSSSVFSA